MLPFFIAKLGMFFAAVNDKCNPPDKDFFFFPTWWKYLQGRRDFLGHCAPHVNFPHDIWLIGLAVLDILLRLAGFVAVVSIFIAGVEFIRTEGNSEKATHARNRLINSLVGLAIVAAATMFVSMLGRVVGGTSSNGLPHVDTSANGDTINHIFNVGFAILGALAFLYIVLAGFRYITSGDNPTKTAEARRQIIYAALGLVIIAMAGTIVNFVLGRLG